MREDQIVRYGRQILLRDLGGKGQERLLASPVRVLGGGPALDEAITYLLAGGTPIELAPGVAVGGFLTGAELTALNPDAVPSRPPVADLLPHELHSEVAQQVVVGAGVAFRTWGLGPYFGDFGAGSDISERAIQAVAEAHLGKGPKTALSELLCAKERVLTVPELLEKISREQDTLPYVARELINIAEEGDEVACSIIEHAGRELGANANLVAGHLGLSGSDYELVLAGGLFRSSTKILVDPLVATVRTVSPDVKPIRLVRPPVVGAVLLAFELAGVPVAETAAELIFSGLDDSLLAAPPERL